MRSETIISTTYDHYKGSHSIVSIIDGDDDYRMSGEGVPGEVFLPAQRALRSAVTRARAQGIDVTRLGTVIRDEKSGSTIVVEGQVNEHRKDPKGTPEPIVLD